MQPFTPSRTSSTFQELEELERVDDWRGEGVVSRLLKGLWEQEILAAIEQLVRSNQAAGSGQTRSARVALIDESTLFISTLSHFDDGWSCYSGRMYRLC